MDECTVETVLSAVFAVIRRTGESEMVSFDVDGEFGVDGLSELTFGSFAGVGTPAGISIGALPILDISVSSYD